MTRSTAKSSRVAEQCDDNIHSSLAATEDPQYRCPNFFSLQVKGPDSEDISSEETLVDQLRQIIQMAKDKENVQPPVGLLTTENRQTWAKLRNKLLKRK
ncbi:hypothetical protein TNCV_4153371 [Trichonephila clavipes]|nr:hypothetical protein TNCV_4153371 [Trichonephila clavipes]